IETLYKYTCPDAMFDGDNKNDTAECHPGTRKSIIADIESWSISVGCESGIMWLTGEVGCEKSAIARTVCKRLNAQDPSLLAGSFFLIKGDNDCNSLKSFVSTIAYHLAVVRPEVGRFISGALTKDRSILDRSLETQWEELIIKPLCRAGPDVHFNHRSLIVIDGLDIVEPQSDPSVRRLLRLLPKLYENNLHHQVAVLVTSRPELDIEFELNRLKRDHSTLFREIALGDTPESREDMRLVLTSSFNRIGQRYQKSIGNHEWPPHDAFDLIIDQADGQFAFLASIARWLEESGKDPVDRLQSLLTPGDSQRAHALAPLNYLYEQVLGKAHRHEDQDLILPILFLLTSGHKPLHILGRLFDKDPHQIRILLQPLRSILRVPDNDSLAIATFPKSFLDYLNKRWASDMKTVPRLLEWALSLDYTDLKHDGHDWTLGTLWLRLPFETIEMTQELVNAMLQTHAADWLHKSRSLLNPQKKGVDIEGTIVRYCVWRKWLKSSRFRVLEKVSESSISRNEGGFAKFDARRFSGSDSAQISTLARPPQQEE
ncbi:hypothetical protein AX16_008367, partial [Volvariella volvacea WC 439]